MRQDERLFSGDCEARAIQVGEINPQWTVVVVDWKSRLFIRTGHEGTTDMFTFAGFETIADAKREAERVLHHHDQSVNVQPSLWENC